VREFLLIFLIWVAFLRQSLNRLQVAYLFVPERSEKYFCVPVRTFAYQKGPERVDLV
jgi:hypothetical protein